MHDCHQAGVTVDRKCKGRCEILKRCIRCNIKGIPCSVEEYNGYYTIFPKTQKVMINLPFILPYSLLTHYFFSSSGNQRSNRIGGEKCYRPIMTSLIFF